MKTNMEWNGICNAVNKTKVNNQNLTDLSIDRREKILEIRTDNDDVK